MTVTTRLLSGSHVLARAIHFFESDRRQKPLREPVLVRDAWNRLVLHEIADELVGERRRRALVAFDQRLFQILKGAELLPIQLGLCEIQSAQHVRFRSARPSGRAPRHPGTSALSAVTSVVRTSNPREVCAARNGAPGLFAISSSRSESMPVKSRSTICCR